MVKSNETKESSLNRSAKGRTIDDPLTDAAICSRPDVAWENDRIAHRSTARRLRKNRITASMSGRSVYVIVVKNGTAAMKRPCARISYHESHAKEPISSKLAVTRRRKLALIEGDSLVPAGECIRIVQILRPSPFRQCLKLRTDPVRFRNFEVRKQTYHAGCGSNLNKIEVTYRCDSARAAFLLQRVSSNETA